MLEITQRTNRCEFGRKNQGATGSLPETLCRKRKRLSASKLLKEVLKQGLATLFQHPSLPQHRVVEATLL